MTLQHAALEVRPEQAPAEVAFWALLGFGEVVPPPSLAPRTTWVQRGRSQIHLLHTSDPVSVPEGHVAVLAAADGYDATVARLRGAGHDAQPRAEHWGAARCFVRTPAGHRVEVMAEAPRVQAAGGVVIDDGRVLVIHRPHYEDWSLPKGKLDRGESFEDAAVREVREETGQTGVLQGELSPHEYVDRKGRPKVVRWWRMALAERAAFVVNDEVDEIRWLTPEEAEGLLTYEHDRRLVAEACA